MIEQETSLKQSLVNYHNLKKSRGKCKTTSKVEVKLENSNFDDTRDDTVEHDDLK